MAHPVNVDELLSGHERDGPLRGPNGGRNEFGRAELQHVVQVQEVRVAFLLEFSTRFLHHHQRDVAASEHFKQVQMAN